MTDHSQKIILHMNKNHQMSLEDYVVVYGNVKPALIKESTVKIGDIDVSLMSLVYQDVAGMPQTLVISWDEAIENESIPVNSFKDIKAKLVAMAKYAANRRGYSHKKITKVLFPGSKDIFMYVLFVLLISEVQDPLLLRSAITNNQGLAFLASKAPEFLVKGAITLETYASLLFSTLYSIHLLEIVFVTLPKLNKYRVPLNKKLIWIIMNFFEGVYAIQRLNSLIDK
ncbi:uncharacterized protein PRCAT00006228001 [Priceomyces carsonii]|uniref:uncharacterized protein n=1 Tax=Priceomyces carsonii TaxID=28549 RepID=UPI002EDB9651|nr:unnamed protein product [Priceomyces carsonii]